MKKIIVVLISILLLASCSQGVKSAANVSASSGASASEVSQASPSPTVAVPSPTPVKGFTSCKQGESVSQHFYTGDLERFFTLQPEELISLLGNNYKDLGFDSYYEDYVLVYNSLNIALRYTFYFESVYHDNSVYYDNIEKPVLPLNRMILSDFSFRGLNKASNFDDIKSTLGATDLLTIHGEDDNGDGYYYALRYTFGALRFEFSSPDEKSAEWLTLTITPSSETQAFYKSCKKGDTISKTLTTGDIKYFLKTPPEELFDILGNRSEIMGYVEDYDFYVAPCDYLGISLQYTCDVDWEEDSIVEIPKLPVKHILIFDFHFRGLSNDSTFKDVMNKLGKTKIRTGYEEDWEYYFLRYKLYGMWFKFSGSDKQASDGIGLSISPAN